MSYQKILEMASCQPLIGRVGAAAAVISRLTFENPSLQSIAWANENMLRLAGTEGWAMSWGASEIEELFLRGESEDVITDSMIEDAVTALMSEQRGSTASA